MMMIMILLFLFFFLKKICFLYYIGKKNNIIGNIFTALVVRIINAKFLCFHSTKPSLKGVLDDR